MKTLPWLFFRFLMTASATVGVGLGLLIATDGLRHGIAAQFLSLGFVLGAFFCGIGAAVQVMQARIGKLYQISREDAAGPVRDEIQKQLRGLCVSAGVFGTVSLLVFWVCLSAAISRIAEGRPLLG